MSVCLLDCRPIDPLPCSMLRLRACPSTNLWPQFFCQILNKMANVGTLRHFWQILKYLWQILEYFIKYFHDFSRLKKHTQMHENYTT